MNLLIQIIEEEIVVVRLLNKQFMPETLFMSLQAVGKANTEGLERSAVEALENTGKCLYWSDKLVGIPSNGAAVNFGCRKGFVAVLTGLSLH